MIERPDSRDERGIEGRLMVALLEPKAVGDVTGALCALTYR